MSTTAFVGREREAESILAGLESARAGKGRLFLLVGEPGIGKTRLAEEIARTAAGKGTIVLWARFRDDGGIAAFWPWQQVVRTAVALPAARAAIDALSELACAHLATLAPELRQIRKLPDTTIELTPNERSELFDAVTALLRSVGRSAPLLLVLDDVHAADPLSAMMLRHLAAELNELPIAIIAGYRSVEGASVLVEMMRCGQYLSLSGLTLAETSHLIEHSYGVTPHDSLLAMMHKLTGGNPFFIDGIATVLSSQGRLSQAWDADGPSPELPAEMRRTVLARMQPLAADAQALLRTAAIIGSEFDAELVRVVNGLSEEQLANLMQYVVFANLATPNPDLAGHYRFSHVLIRNTVYGEMNALERARHHAVVAKAMEQLYADRIEERLDAIAHHYGQGSGTGTAELALDYLLRAARQAMTNLAYEAAALYATRALEYRDALARLDDTGRAQIHLLLGNAEVRSGKRQAANAAFMQAAMIGRRANLPALLAQAALGQASGIGGLVDSVPDFAAIAMLEEALMRLPVSELRMRVRCMARLSVELYRAGDLARSQRMAREAVLLLAELSEPGLRLDALLGLAWTLVGPDGLHERIGVAAECLQLACALGDRESEFHARHVTIETLLAQGDGDGVDAQILACDRIAQALRQAPLSWQVGVLRTMRALMSGRIADARQLSNDTYAIGLEAVGELATHNFHTEQFDIVWADGYLQEMIEPFRRAAEQATNASAWAPGLILACLAAGHREEARIQFDCVLLQGLDRIPRDTLWVSMLTMLGEACARLNDQRAAAELIEYLRPWAPGAVIILAGRHCMGSSSRILGLLCATLQRWDEAFAHFADALAFDSRLGAFRWHTYTLCDQAEVLLVRDAAGDREHAITLLKRCLQTASQLGVSAITRRAAALLESTGHNEAAAELAVDDVSLLTDRRLQIVRLAARGLSNKDIARELRIGERTIKDHWSFILARLGARNRAQAISLAHRLGYVSAEQQDAVLGEVDP